MFAAALFPPTVSAQPSLFRICGEVLINGIPVSDSTYVEARIDGEEVANTNTNGSNYCFEISGETSDLSDQTITFVIKNKDRADEIATWEADQTIDLDLNVTISAPSYITFPDPGLEAVIREAIGKPFGNISRFDLEELTAIAASSIGIGSLNGLEYCTNLTELYIPDNIIVDISALKSLNRLTSVTLSSNQISDISALSDLTSLSYLHLGQNRIADVSPLSSLANLTKLYLSNNRISSIPSLSNLASLSNLSLSSNKLEDISTLSNLRNLKALWLYNNQIEDISPLSSLTSLAALDLRQNQINDVSPLSGLAALTNLMLNANKITDISPFSDFPNIEQLSLNENQITDISAIADMTTLRRVSLDSNEITDLSAVSELYNLSELSLQDNQITDISPLIDSGLADNGRLVSINLYDNPLSFAQETKYLPQLEEKGISVNWGSLADDTRIPSPTPTTSSDGNDEDAIGGIVGGVFLFSFIGIILFYILQRRKHAQMEKNFKQKLYEWEQEGYDISEFKNRWFG